MCGLPAESPVYSQDLSPLHCTLDCLESEVKCVTLAPEGALEGRRAEAELS